MKKSNDPYVKKVIAQIRKDKKPKRKPRRIKVSPISLQTRGFDLSMNYNPKSAIDKEILDEAIKLITRRAS